MRKASVKVDGRAAGTLIEDDARRYRFEYDPGYRGAPVSLTMPVRQTPYEFDTFPACFEGLLPEGAQLEALLRQRKLDRSDGFGQLLAVGQDMVGAVTVEEIP